MNIAVLGTGVVGQTLGSALIECGHNVTLGSRSADNRAGSEWANRTGGRCATFADAVSASDLVINATSGGASIAALELVGADLLGTKVLIDVANPLDFSNGFPPQLSICNDSSLGEQIQERFPDVRVVKSLNTVNCELMVAPSALGHDHAIFVAGNDEGAKLEAVAILTSLGWRSNQILDLGDISAARATEMYLPLWLQLMTHIGSPDFNIQVVRGRE